MRRRLFSVCTIVWSAIVSGCAGGGTDGTGAVPTPAAVTSSGAMTKGSVILNGTRYDDTTAAVTDDRNRTALQLGDGMVVKLRGRSDDGVTGVAEQIQVENDVRGPIQSNDAAADPQRFTVAGLTVVVDSVTIYPNLNGFGSLGVGKRVEVHGLRDADGLLRATRIEAVDSQAADELRGPATGIDTAADRFTLNGNIVVNYASAVFAPAGRGEADLANGSTVEVRGTVVGNVLSATQIDIEDAEDEPFRGVAGEKQEAQGFVSGFATHPGTFQVNQRAVQTTAATRFIGGAAADLDNNVEVEVKGVVDAQSLLVAATIKFKRTRVVLHGLATNVDTVARTLVVLNQTVHVNDLTRLNVRGSTGANSDRLADITPNVDCVEVWGYLDGAAFVAERIREPNNCTRDLVQARVIAKDEASALLTLFPNLAVSLPLNAQYLDANEALTTRA
ncbi:MAG TPA: DUF5666 domain-containing protein, partial [Burkholderiaceae bacterium]|nr:DUF5666 domain-containing protein [Burkholderiaceae bacterium]